MNTLKRLKELQAAATPGPWDRVGFYNVLRIARKSLDWELVNPTEDASLPDEDDAEFIVALHEALPALLAVAEAAKLYLMACDNLHDADSGSKAEWIAGYWADEKERALRDALAKLEVEK